MCRQQQQQQQQQQILMSRLKPDENTKTRGGNGEWAWKRGAADAAAATTILELLLLRAWERGAADAAAATTATTNARGRSS